MKKCKDVLLFPKLEREVLNKVVLREENAVDSFHFSKGISSDDGKDCVFVKDPIYEAFNGQRLAQLGKMNVEAWFESLKQKPLSSIQQLRMKCSDDDLLSMMKSRYCQSPADLAAWSDYLANNMDQFNAELAKIARAKEQESNEVEPKEE